MRGDYEKEIRELLTTEPSLKNDYINKPGDHTALCMAAYFGSIISSKILIEVKLNLTKVWKRCE
jgi:hypothetical protein